MKSLGSLWAAHFKTSATVNKRHIALKALFVAIFWSLTGALAYSPIAYGQDLRIQSNEGAQPGNAATVKGVAVVDFEYALRASDAAIDLRSQIDTLRNRLEKDFKADRDALRREETALTALKSEETNSKEANMRRRAFDERVSTLQRRIQQANSLIEDAYSKALTQIRSKLIDAVAEVARTGRYDLILRRSQAIIFRQSIDETAAAIATLNNQVSHVNLDIDASAMASILSRSKAPLETSSGSHSEPKTERLEE